MEFSARAVDPSTLITDCLIVPVGEGKKLPNTTRQIDKATGKLISRRLENNDLSGKLGSTLMLHEPKGISAKRLLLVGVGKTAPTVQQFIRICQTAAKALTGNAIKTAATSLTQIKIADHDERWAATQLCRQVLQASYAFKKQGATNGPSKTLKRFTVLCENRKSQQANKAGIALGSAIATAVNRARHLGDMPANTCTPGFLAREARALGRKHQSIRTHILSEKHMAELKMGALLSVAAGSKQNAHLIAMEYTGASKSTKPIVLVGKGVTFDSGGISLKPGSKMDEMKYDMCGAASVFGVMEALALILPELNVVGLVPAVENMPSGEATRPGDVVKSMSGKTIEILNTDAEGRLILCDALTYAARYKPDTVIDIATLTGACVVALGSHASGLFSNDDKLAKQLLAAGQSSGDRAWRMPLWEEYGQGLKSNFADLPNIGGAGGGSITAACFLSNFTKDYCWAHMDIAGSAWNSAGPKGATGRPVPLLVEYLLNRVI
jgi:leucyl aminopeptidase